MKVNQEPELINHLDNLMEHVHKSASSQQTIDILIRWMVDTFQLCGSAFVRIQSGKGLGAEWLSFYPEDLFSSKLHEIDFNDQALIYQRKSKPFIIERSGLLSLNEVTRDWAIRQNIHSALLIPIQYKMDIESLLLLYRREEQPQFSQLELKEAAFVTRFVANLLKWQIITENTEQYAKELDQMLRASLSMTESLNLNDVLNAILDNALELIPDVNDAHIFLYENYILNFGAAKFCDGTTGTVWAEPRDNGLTYRVARTGKTIRVDNMSEDSLFLNMPNWQGSIIGIPLINNEDVLGVMTLAKLEPVGFSNHETDILNRLGNQAANVIHNVRTHNVISLQAFTDSLTALPNRRSFEWEAQKILDQAQRYQRSFTVAMLDLDEFKRINDTYGHAIGDDSLRIIAHCMKNELRKTDFLARFGGDEFVILFT
ncbi:MAG: diguanylate cyclase, partial [Anaerolineaceae bacterium]|nr:diguanylate cyclase [Anaerolineaceae bacterium]